jgi:MFS family permease
MGRNAQYAAIGGIIGAASMGAIGSVFSVRAVFLLTASLALPALYALRGSSRAADEIHPDATGCLRDQAAQPASSWVLLRDRRLLVFAGCVFLFFLSNAAVVPTAVSTAAKSAAPFTTVMIAALIIVPQIIVAVASRRVGRAAEQFGRRPLLLLGFGSLPLRAALFAAIANPMALVLVQPLEGLGAVVFGVMLPLVAADLTRGTGRYNLCLGLLGLMGTLGAAASTAFAGFVAAAWGRQAALAALSAVGVVAVSLVSLAMPETYHSAAMPTKAAGLPAAPQASVDHARNPAE